MKTSRALFGLLVVTGLGLAVPALAEDAADHTAHHPAAGAPTMAPAPGPAANMSGMGQTGMTDGDKQSMMSNMMPIMGGMMSSRTEGRLAFLKTELKIKAGQSAAWERFADAYRAAAKSMQSMHGGMMGMMQGDLPSRLTQHQKMMQAHLDALKAISGPLTALYASFDSDQKKSADDLLSGVGGVRRAGFRRLHRPLALERSKREGARPPVLPCV